MKKSLLATSCALVLGSLALPAVAEVSLSANVALTTDYVWRGISQNNEDAAIQGGFDLGLDNGIYAGIWGSNVSTGEGSLEIDYYVGYANETDGGLGYDLGAILYTFPGTEDWDTEEYYFGLSYSMFSGMVSYSDDLEALYWDLGMEYELPEEFVLGLHYGYWDADGWDQSDWKVGVSKTFFDLDFELAYTDTDIEDVDIADSRVVLTVSKSWE